MAKDASDEDKPKKWSKIDDKTLHELFRRGPRSKGINPKDLSKKNIELAITKFFPGRNYRSFSQLFRNKARAFNLGQTLSGA
jgi:hypothetical protein